MAIFIGWVEIIPWLMCVSRVHTGDTFIVDLQSSGEWSENELIQYQGKIAELKEFTSCHWEYDRYIATDTTNIWAYCVLPIRNDTVKKCAQLYYQGDQTLANRDVIFYAWFEGWTKKPINIKVQINSFKHRSWNHFCWTYSSLSGRNTLYHDGILVADKLLPSNVPHPILPGSEDVQKYLFVIGQDPDTLEGDYSEDQAVFGSIAEFNLWNKIIDHSIIKEMAKCKKLYKGNVIAWEVDNLRVNEATIRKTKNVKQFCDQERELVVFPDSQSFVAAQETCSSHGGTLVVPNSEEEDKMIINMMKNHAAKCFPKNRAFINVGKVIWLGLEIYNNTWFRKVDGKRSPLNYTNWDTQDWDDGCAFVTSDGYWDHAGAECDDMQLCLICSIPKSTVFTLKGICKKGSIFQWNYYLYINSTNQINSYEGYKRSQNIFNKNGVWTLEVEGDIIQLNNTSSPIGRNPWKWYERSCGISTLEKRNLTLSLCVVDKEFTCDSGHCVSLENRCDGEKDCNDGSDEKVCDNVQIPVEYEKIHPPKFKVGQQEMLWVYFRVFIESVNHVDTTNMIIEVTLKIDVTWRDTRLIFKNLNQNGRNFVAKRDYSKIWLPLNNIEHKTAVIETIREDLDKDVEILVNYQNQTTSHKLPVDVFENREEYRYNNKENVLRIRQRYRIDYNCVFELSNYPFDEHPCEIAMNFKSSRYENVAYVIANDTVQYTGSKSASHYRVVNVTSSITSLCSRESSATTRCNPKERNMLITQDGFLFTIYLKRNSDHHLKTIFIPCIGLWIVAYSTVFVRTNDFSNRNRISVTVLLALMTLFGATTNTDDYPKTTHLKYIDVWFLFYLTNIFLIIAHHMAVEVMGYDNTGKTNIEPNLILNLGMTNKSETDKTSLRRRKQRYLNVIVTILFPLTMLVFNVGYFCIAT